MNNIREIERLNQRELEAGIPLIASWHNDWSDTAYVYIGGLPYELSEGDIVTIFSQYGEPVHVHLVRDKDTGKSKGFAFLKYEDQRSTVLAVDNLGSTVILGRTIRVDHTRYKPKEGDNVEIGANVYGGQEREAKRRKKNECMERRVSVTQWVLPEELELQDLIERHDDEDPMKQYLIDEKWKEVEKARKSHKSNRRLVKKSSTPNENMMNRSPVHRSL